MPHPDEELIHAWLDGELDAARAARVEALVAGDPAWAAAAAEARGLIAASGRIVRALDHVPSNVVPDARMPARRHPWWMARVAALLVVVAGTAIVLTRTTPDESLRAGQSQEEKKQEAAAQRAVPPAQSRDRALAGAKRTALGDRLDVPQKAPTPAATPAPTAAAGGAATSVAASKVAAAAPPVATPVVPVAEAAGARTAGLPVRAAEADAARQLTAKRDERFSVTCYEILEALGTDREQKVRAQAVGQSRSGARPDSLARSAPRQVLALSAQETPARSEAAEQRDRPAANAPAVAPSRQSLVGLMRNESADTLVVTWRDGTQANTARATARGDTLIGTASAEGRATQAFRAVRTPCPAP